LSRAFRLHKPRQSRRFHRASSLAPAASPRHITIIGITVIIGITIIIDITIIIGITTTDIGITVGGVTAIGIAGNNCVSLMLNRSTDIDRRSRLAGSGGGSPCPGCFEGGRYR